MPRHYTGRKPRRDPNATVFVFKVSLMGNKDIWRRIAIRSDQTLDHLHAVIYRAFDRDDEHLYSFYTLFPGEKRWANPRNGVEYTSPIEIKGAISFKREPVRNAGKTTIGSLGLTRRAKLRYLFDFGDEWWHILVVEETDGKPGPG